ncbi:hypothetical protein D1859_17335 [Priestia flexa]|jgi:hypothetical protein|nr:hypothetical protein D1859_17335 [Priestia flexa]
MENNEKERSVERMKHFIGIFTLAAVLTGCQDQADEKKQVPPTNPKEEVEETVTTPKPSQPIKQPPVQAVDENIHSYIKKYAEAYAKAVTAGSIKEISPFLKKGSVLYNTELAKINELNSKKISYKLLNVKLMGLQKTDDGYVIKVEESFEQAEPGKGSQTVMFNKSYTTSYKDGKLMIVDIKEEA